MANPYLELIDIMGKATPIPSLFMLGVVKSKLPDITISIDNIILDKDDLLINSNLITLNNADISTNNADVKVANNLKDEINVNDQVLLCKVGDTFILLSKVVSI